MRGVRGVCSSVAISTSSTWSSRIEGGRPGRGSSTSPSSRWATNRPRQRVTGPRITRNSAATCLFVAPSAQASTIFARSANACAVFARRDHRVSCSRSASVSTSSAFGRPGRGHRSSRPRPRLRTACATWPPSSWSHPDRPPPAPTPPPARRTRARSSPAPPAAPTRPATARAARSRSAIGQHELASTLTPQKPYDHHINLCC